METWERHRKWRFLTVTNDETESIEPEETPSEPLPSRFGSEEEVVPDGYSPAPPASGGGEGLPAYSESEPLPCRFGMVARNEQGGSSPPASGGGEGLPADPKSETLPSRFGSEEEVVPDGYSPAPPASGGGEGLPAYSESETLPSRFGSAGEIVPGGPLQIPELCLVVLVGASGSGKSTFARAHFKPTEIISSDTCRAWVSDDELDQSATADAFDVVHFIAAKRLERGKLTVIDATNVQPEARKVLIRLAKSQNVLATAIVLNVPERVCQERNDTRTDRRIPPQAISRQCQNLRQSLRDLKREGFRHTFVLTPDQLADVRFERTKLWTDKRDDHGPFDIIGDLHGCDIEFKELLGMLGYVEDPAARYRHPEGRKALFVGDLVDRGPGVIEVLDIARAMVESGTALCVCGNHDEKFLRWLNGKHISVTHGVQESINQVESLPAETRDEWKRTTAKFLDSLISHYVLDGGKLVVAHAGITEKLQGRASGHVREFCLYGDTSGELDDDGLPIRRDWAADYRGAATVVYGHTPQASANWINNTINIDTGCVFGGELTALQWPEREIVSVIAKATYRESPRAFKAPDPPKVEIASPFDLLLSDVYPTQEVSSGNRRVTTRLAGNILIQRANSAAALEIMSRFAVDPRWIVYLPPTMSPCQTQAEGPFLEHPDGAFKYFRDEGITNLICEEKHMGSRAVIVICKNSEAAYRRFGITVQDAIGECYTRTGRRFLDEPVRTLFLSKVQAAMTATGFWETHSTDWAVIDAEIMPWNTKAQGLLREQYAPVGAAANASLTELDRLISKAKSRGVVIDDSEIATRRDAVTRYIDSYRAYCWPTHRLEGVKVAPFHLLATEGAVHTDKDHAWHLYALSAMCDADPVLFKKTDTINVNLADESSVQAVTAWWLEKTAKFR